MLLKEMIKKSNLTSTEKQLAVYIVNNSLEVVHMNQNELAEAAFVSPAAISRFCRKMNCGNYSDFKVMLARDIESTKGKVIDNNYPFAADADIKTIAESICSANEYALKSCYDKLDEKKITRIVDDIIRTKGIDIYAIGASAACCLPFCESMVRINIPTYVHSNMTDQLIYNSFGNGFYKIIVSHSGKVEQLVDIADMLNAEKVPFLFISANRFSPITTKCSLAYIVETDEELSISGKIGMFSSQAVFSYLLNIIFCGVFSRNYDENLQKLEKTAALQQKAFRK